MLNSYDLFITTQLETLMLNPKNIETIAKKIMEAIPQEIGKIPEDTKSQIKSAITSSFASMDLVTREEFDIQLAVLAKTRMKLEALEKKLIELEKSAD
jgi:BMFP domain-containing protein YqiC